MAGCRVSVLAALPTAHSNGSLSNGSQVSALDDPFHHPDRIGVQAVLRAMEAEAEVETGPETEDAERPPATGKGKGKGKGLAKGKGRAAAAVGDAEGVEEEEAEAAAEAEGREGRESVRESTSDTRAASEAEAQQNGNGNGNLQGNEYLAVWLTEHGGHIGWPERVRHGGNSFSFVARVAGEFFAAARQQAT
jgi:hypothetical protein